MAAIARDYKTPISIVEGVIAANEQRRQMIVERVVAALGGTVKNRKIAVLGIAFKAETDDIRDAAALPLIPALQAMGAVISAYDPAAMEHGRKTFQNVEWCTDLYMASIQADAVVILTEWNEFRGVDLSKLKALMKTPLIVDFRNLYLPKDVARAGFTYHSLGRASHHPV